MIGSKFMFAPAFKSKIEYKIIRLKENNMYECYSSERDHTIEISYLLVKYLLCADKKWWEKNYKKILKSMNHFLYFKDL